MQCGEPSFIGSMSCNTRGASSAPGSLICASCQIFQTGEGLDNLKKSRAREDWGEVGHPAPPVLALKYPGSSRNFTIHKNLS